MKGWLIITDDRGVERSFFVALPDREEAAAIVLRDIGSGTILTRAHCRRKSSGCSVSTRRNKRGQLDQ